MAEYMACGEARIAHDVRGSGPALLLMHGAEADRHMFTALVPLLSPHFSVVAYDQRDCGQTEAPQRPATLAELAADAAALVSGLGFERAHVFGSSFGGRVAQALAALHPRVVDRLVLGSTWPLPHRLSDLNPTGMATIQALRQGLPDTAEALASWFFPASFLQERPELRRVFAKVQAGSERTHRRACTVESSLDIDWRALDLPVLLLAGELDRVVPMGVTLGMASTLPRSEQAVLAGVGHATALQAPEAVAARLLQFLSASTPTR